MSESRVDTDGGHHLPDGTPTLFGAPFVPPAAAPPGFDVAFLGLCDHRPTAASPADAASPTSATSASASVRLRHLTAGHGGYLPELDLDVFERLRLADLGEVGLSPESTASPVEAERVVADALAAGCLVVTLGSAVGPATWPVARALAGSVNRAGGRLGVVNFSPYHGNGATVAGEVWPGARNWVACTLALPGVDPLLYAHVGLRGPRNDRDLYRRFAALGVTREQIYTAFELRLARRNGEEGLAGLAQALVERSVADADRVWLVTDPRCLDAGSFPDFGDEPLGLRLDEHLDLCHAIARAAGPRLAGISFAGVPADAPAVQWAMIWATLYALAGRLADRRH